ncbi:NADP-dependent oxidoreductase [Streptacidiphilus sp. ASG 303]|uniref:NADP-dependent oxidoreductase n=1 Tax=Streptacidiphilus sp. ASG 303 TaxID=2896847 RepID=UPI001E4174FE|nr:NADP-dependent oxidoreductase [Streptacidiphilus sp. ASG 303]MCD0484217.1 NADP-dependent oxidoreductase [Streptacidiphilus sp. ASG 303]
MSNTMHAVRAHRRGGPEQLVHEEAPRPEPGPGEVLVAVRSASITSGELTWDASWTDSFDGTGHDRTPVIPSHEFSGVVAALGGGVTSWAEGDEVYGLVPFTQDGAAAEYVCLAADILAPKPAAVDHDRAAAAPLAGLTAWQALVDHAGLRAGQHVLVHGGAGGVGSFVVQIAAALGAEVTATAGAADLDFVRGLGATRVVDYAHGHFEDHVGDVDVVVDLAGGATLARSWAVLRPGGVLVGIAEPPDPQEAARHGVRGVFFVVEPDSAGLRSVGRLIDEGRLTPAVDRVLPLSEARAGYEALAREHRRGKVVLHVSG